MRSECEIEQHCFTIELFLTIFFAFSFTQQYNDEFGTLPGEPNKCDKLVLDFDSNTKRELLVVDKRLSLKLKPHQFDGVKFMWDACFESIEKSYRSNGSGCILGHCMGLGM